MTCYVCGSQMPEGARFCPVCGRFYPPSEAPVEVAHTNEPVVDADPAPAEPIPEFIEDCGGIPEDFVEVIQEELPRKKKKRAVLVPTLIMAAMFTIGSVLFFLFPSSPSDPADPAETTSPVAGQAPEESTPSGKPQLPSQNKGQSGGNRAEDFVPTDADCFQMTSAGLIFLLHEYDGGAVLVIPEEIDGVAVTSIAPNGFAGCEGVTTLILPDTLEFIGDGAFAGCNDLRGIWIPDSVRQIGDGAFQNCIGLESVAIQSGVESIGENAFAGCAKLLYFFYDGSYADWRELYNEYVTPFTYVTCVDGDYYHGVKMP